jgi:hypothetical protein
VGVASNHVCLSPDPPGFSLLSLLFIAS